MTMAFTQGEMRMHLSQLKNLRDLITREIDTVCAKLEKEMKDTEAKPAEEKPAEKPEEKQPEKAEKKDEPAEK